MRTLLKTMLVVGALALSAAPALAHGKPENAPPGEQGTPANEHANGSQGQNGNGPNYQPAEPPPGPKAGLPEKAKAYGRYCKGAGASRKHVKDEKGTPFSQCVTGLAKAANHEHMNPHRACKDVSKEHVEGQKGTPYSQCVTGVAHLRREEKREAREKRREEREEQAEEEQGEGEA